jgi:hypothetical protein
MRRRRVWAGVIGAIIGWGIAGLDGGFAGTVDIPMPRADFVATGILTSSRDGIMPFDLVRSGRLVRQVVVVADDRVETVFDRFGAYVTVVDTGMASVPPKHGATASLLDPFSSAQRVADAPLHIARDGMSSHIGIPCERFRAIGTTRGKPLRATACITSDGIPLVAVILSAPLILSTEITAIDFSRPDLDVFIDPSAVATVNVTDG